jgi:outer membrane protein assembly factor BamB
MAQTETGALMFFVKLMQFHRVYFVVGTMLLMYGASISSHADLADGLVVHLKMDNDSKDASGRQNDARLIQHPRFVEGRVGSHAMRFDGANDCLSLGMSPDLKFGKETDFSVSLWIKTDGWSSDPCIISNKSWKNGKSEGWGIFAGEEGKWKLNLADGAKRVDKDGGIINDGVWHQIAVSCDREGIAVLFQDGLSIGSLDISAIGDLNSLLPTIIAQDGSLAYPEFFPGVIDDVCIWRRCLTAGEIHDIFITGMSGNEFTIAPSRKAALPLPANGEDEIVLHPVLRWRAARDAVNYDLYFDANEKRVAEADKTSPAFKTTLREWSFSPPRLHLGNTYFWRVDAIAEDGTVEKGEVWSFQTKRNAVAAWRFHESALIAPNRVKPEHGKSAGVISGPVKFTTTPDSFVFDGMDNFITIERDDSAPTRFPTPAITVDAWVYMDVASRRGGILACQNQEPMQDWWLGCDNYRFTFALSLQGKLQELHSGKYYTTERWFHVAATYDGFSIKMYIDGKLDHQEKIAAQSSDRIHIANEIGQFVDRKSGEACFFSGRIHEVRLFDRALSEDEVLSRYEAGKSQFPGPTELAFGPYLQFIAPDEAIVRWQTEQPVPSILEYGEKSASENRMEDSTPKTDHEVAIAGLKFKKKYLYIIKIDSGDQLCFTPEYECDNFFNYSLPAIPVRPSPYPNHEKSAEYRKAAESILAQCDFRKGYCLVVGSDSGQLVYELAKQSGFFVHGVDTDSDRVNEARRLLKKAGLYGGRATIRHVESYSRLPFSGDFANLIVSDRMMKEKKWNDSVKELYRVLRPDGGVALLGTSQKHDPFVINELKKQIEIASLPSTILEDEEGTWIKIVRPPLPGAGEWTHQYGRPDNAANSLDSLQGATQTGDLEVQWIGRPGPRAMVDRNPRKPAPLAINGRLFIQGLNRMIAQDAFNGAILWSLEIPALQRYNMPRDCSNWCADKDFLYAAINGQCWRIDAATGVLTAVYDVVLPENRNWQFDWSYIARVGEKLYGSAVKKGTSHTNFWGGSETGWADATSGPITFKICSDNLYALDPKTGETIWTYEDGVIINPTITIADGCVFFVECRNAKVKAGDARRVGPPDLWQDQFLVALNAETGQIQWQRPIDVEDGIIVFYLLYTNDTLLIASSNNRYHLYAYDAQNGDFKWYVNHDWIKDNHGQHMQHPAVVGDVVYLRPCGYKIGDGSLITKNMPPHEGGCATFAATTGALIYRGKQGSISMWDVKTEEVSHWFSLRPDCWLSTIAAGGMVLAPEGGGGCSCGGWLETSVGFILADNPMKMQ